MKRFRNLFITSVGLTTIGFLLDSDPQKGTVWLSIFEFAAMAIMIFALLLISAFTYRKVRHGIIKLRTSRP